METSNLPAKPMDRFKQELAMRESHLRSLLPQSMTVDKFQGIVVAAVATGGRADSPDAGTVLRSVFWHSVALALLMGLLVMAQAYWLPWMIVK